MVQALGLSKGYDPKLEEDIEITSDQFSGLPLSTVDSFKSFLTPIFRLELWRMPSRKMRVI